MAVNRTFDFTAGARQVGSEEPTPAALLQPKPKISYNPLHYAWIAWENFAYFLAPANGCAYCLALRMFILGIVVGAYLIHFFPWIRIW